MYEEDELAISFNEIRTEDRELAIRASGQWSLGQLIKHIESLPLSPSTDVRFDFPEMAPSNLNCYRGSYTELAINYKIGAPYPNAITFLGLLKSVIGKRLPGYKGGEFMMIHDTPLWVGNASCHSRIGIVGVKTEMLNDKIVTIWLMTSHCEHTTRH